MKLSECINKNTILFLESGTYTFYSGEININEFITVAVKDILPEDIYSPEDEKNVIILNESHLVIDEKLNFDKLYILTRSDFTIGGDACIKCINSHYIYDENLSLEQEQKINDRLHKSKRIKL